MRTCLRCLLYLGSYNLGLLAKPLNSAYNEEQIEQNDNMAFVFISHLFEKFYTPPKYTRKRGLRSV